MLHQLAAVDQLVASFDQEQTKVKELVTCLDGISSRDAVALEGLVRAISILTEQQGEGCTRLAKRMSAMVAKVTARMTEHVRKITGVYNGQINSHLDELENQAGQPALTSLREKWIAIDKVDKDVTDEAGKELVEICQDAAAKAFYERYKILKKVMVNELQCPKFVMQSVSTFEKRANVQPEESAPITSLTERWAVETPRHKTTMGNMSAIQALFKGGLGTSRKGHCKKLLTGIHVDQMVISKVFLRMATRIAEAPP